LGVQPPLVLEIRRALCFIRRRVEVEVHRHQHREDHDDEDQPQDDELHAVSPVTAVHLTRWLDAAWLRALEEPSTSCIRWLLVRTADGAGRGAFAIVVGPVLVQADLVPPDTAIAALQIPVDKVVAFLA